MAATKSKLESERYTLLSDDDVFLFNEGNHHHLFEKLGAKLVTHEGKKGTHFAVWAPNAKGVGVSGSFNNWNTKSCFLHPRASSGVWEGFVPGVGHGDLYKYTIQAKNGAHLEKADPFAYHAERTPKSASVVWDLKYEWKDLDWMQKREKYNSLKSPISIYELHAGSWRLERWEYEAWLNYRDLAHQLVPYLKETGFTHVELMPIMEHPFTGSWGYQVTGFYAPTSRFGTPQDFMYFVDYLHQNGIGVFLDWVPSHFPGDGHGLAVFDGTHLYEHSDPRQGYHPDWGSYIFNYGRHEVRNFLISNALFWLEKYHIDGLRVDAVASMLYLDYSRKKDEWIPNYRGGNENLEAIHFIRTLNEVVYKYHPSVQMIAEESTAWAMVSRPTSIGGLGFGMKWDMGWMHDTLEYFTKDPVHRKYHHNDITFRLLYAFHENFVLSLSHDEVVHGKRHLLEKMPGDSWQQFANLRLLYSYMFMQSGKKLLFMGSEFGQRNEWDHGKELDWHLLGSESHLGIKALIGDLNRLYRQHSLLYENDFDPSGFEWIDASNYEASIIAFERKGKEPHEILIAVFNYTPVPRTDYRIGASLPGKWVEIFNSDRKEYWGSGILNSEPIYTTDSAWHGRNQSITITLPPLGATVLQYFED